MKTCTKCGKEKPESAFGKETKGAGGLMSRCKDCMREYGRSWCAQNREHLAAKARQYHSGHREEINARARIAGMTPEQRSKKLARKHAYNIANRDARKAWRKNYEDTDERRAVHVIAGHNRRVSSGPKITPEIVAELHAEYGGMCPYCQKMIVRGHIDHIRPVNNGGTNARENLVYCCAECNWQKRDKSLLEFLLYRCELARVACES